MPITKHGMTGTPIYKVWKSMRTRCSPNARIQEFQYYGAKGIQVCDEWQEFKPFYDWCIKNNWVHKLQIDRIDGNKGYSPENCRIVTPQVNCDNRACVHKIEFNGEIKTISEWSKVIGIKKHTIEARLFVYKWPIENALSSQKFAPNKIYYSK